MLDINNQEKQNFDIKAIIGPQKMKYKIQCYNTR